MTRELTYRKHRGCHHWTCLICGKRERERIPDQAAPEYQHNPANPIIGLCPNCNHGIEHGGLCLGPQTCPVPGTDETQDTPLDYGKLQGEWGEWAEVARRFEHKAADQDRDDLRHTIILELAEQRERNRQNGNKPITEWGMLRIAGHTVADYYRAQKRNGKVISLNTEVEDGEGDTVEVGETLADDTAIDLDAWTDARVWLLGCPRRLVEIAVKRVKGEALDKADQKYLERFWRKAQKSLL